MGKGLAKLSFNVDLEGEEAILSLAVVAQLQVVVEVGGWCFVRQSGEADNWNTCVQVKDQVGWGWWIWEPKFMALVVGVARVAVGVVV